MKKTSIWIAIIFFVFILQSYIVLGVNSSEKPKLAPVNPQFSRYQEEVKAGKYQAFSSDGHPLGYIPQPVDLSHIKGVVDKSVLMSYPVTYDLRTQGKLTSVKNQGQCGACWAFGAIASLESYLMPTQSKDFSEQHLNHTHGFDYAECAGGNSWMTTAYFGRWDGPLSETDMPYPYTSSGLSDVKAYTVQKHVQQVIFLPDRANKLDNDTIKYFITNYGAVSCTYYTSDAYYNNIYHSYYFPGSLDTNHIVAIVGWDDNFSASKFNTAPAGDGAFIVKNSWGSDWQDGGYFYMSYYDAKVTDFNSYNNAESTSNYSDVYQYDTLGWVENFGWEDPVAWGANIFAAQDSLPIKAVGFYTNDVNTSYNIYVYKGVTAGAPTSGTLAGSKSGTKTYPGYYTETLDIPVLVSSGEKFSVVIKFTNSSYLYPITAEGPLANYSMNATAESGQSYISFDGTDWGDLTDSAANTNVCIKAFSGVGSTTPFGEFATPINGSSVSSSVPVTGWALDDVGVANVKIYNGDSYLGDAVFIEGARPDVQVAYPSYPFNNKAGWGYMLLTHFLPNGGNGTFTLYAKATDKEGQEVTLGSKTIYCDNEHAVKPFGAIDTPSQGGSASGKSFVNFGWALTPMPNSIPISGSTITVYVDGVSKGHPGYNVYRQDIASLFPGYANSNGAIGYYYFDTTKYKDGTHTIHWIASDTASNADGIGSRYFSIQNSKTSSPEEQTISKSKTIGSPSISQLANIPIDSGEPVRLVKGYNEKLQSLPIEQDERGIVNITVREDERVKFYLGAKDRQSSDIRYTGYHIIETQLAPLPIGSTLDSKDGIFYWQPSAGFLGDYRFVFIATDPSGAITQKKVHIKIIPKY